MLAMNNQPERLRAAIAELERELAQLEATDPETRSLLTEAAQDISAALARTGTKQPAADVSESKGIIADKVLEFEASHPRISQALTRIVDILGQFGI